MTSAPLPRSPDEEGDGIVVLRPGWSTSEASTASRGSSTRCARDTRRRCPRTCEPPLAHFGPARWSNLERSGLAPALRRVGRPPPHEGQGRPAGRATPSTCPITRRVTSRAWPGETGWASHRPTTSSPEWNTRSAAGGQNGQPDSVTGRSGRGRAGASSPKQGAPGCAAQSCCIASRSRSLRGLAHRAGLGGVRCSASAGA
jgi:hypothetical protein